MSAAKEIIFEAKNIKKYYGATHANDDVSIALPRGEVRGLIGENGSGKSTLISIISGMNTRDSGEMVMLGKAYEPKGPLDAGEAKIGTVVQELGLVDGLPVGVNVFLGRTAPYTKAGIMSMGKLYSAASALFEKWGFPGFPVRTLTGQLSVEEKKIVELVRALSIEPELLILDEITQALSLNNRNTLFGIIRQLKEEGKAVLMVTHDVEEMVEITDCITIMRDGEVVAEKMCDDTDAEEVKRLMVGRELSGSYYRADTEASYEDEVVLRVKNLTTTHFHDVSFDLHKSEILGVCGLSDAGIHELAETLFAVREKSDGDVVLANGDTVVKSPWQAMEMKMGYVPKDRDKQALMVNDSIENNVCLPAVEMVKKPLGFLSPKERRNLANQVVDMFEVKTKGITQILSGLSGGNRQKVNLGRWMVQDKDILILDCPTRGVDVGVKSYIYHVMAEAKEKGVAMVVVSDELPELIGMCDTLLVMKEGAIVKSFKRGAGMTEETIIEVML